MSLYDCVCGGDRAITLLSYQRLIHFSTGSMNKNINEIKNDTLRCHFLGTVIILGGKITTSVYYHELNDLSRVKHFEIQRKIIGFTRFTSQFAILFIIHQIAHKMKVYSGINSYYEGIIDNAFSQRAQTPCLACILMISTTCKHPSYV